ncbi:MAG: DUF1553 domain-containing protein [Planctomycetota bacterium]|nr:DUF1553 domain-containing protein [Planctomycetota bacterium]
MSAIFSTNDSYPKLHWVLLFVAAQCLNGFSADPIPSASNPSLKFELDIQPILTARGCNSGPCHGKARGQNGFALSLLGFDANMDYEAIVKNSRGRRLSVASPTESLLLNKAIGKEPHGGGIRFSETDEDYRLLLKWIQTGLARTTDSDPTLVSVEVAPAPHSLMAGQTESLTVTARYNDGSSRNVTPMCAFQSNEPAIVSVASNGQLKAGALPGEATIMARYMGKITTWSTAVPRPEPIAIEQYNALPRNNFIDDLVYQKLSTLNILPSSDCTDTLFIRRLYLDAIGRLPTPAELKAYEADMESNKHSRWAQSVLELPEYADFWANKWADLLRPNPYRVGIKATYSLDAWLRDAFRKNLPYDQFVRQIVTAQGSNWRNGAVTLFRDRREPEEITTIVSQLFLGVRLECAKCHQHPFEVYSQADFYGMAAYFARVGYKGTGLSPPISGGEEIVFSKATGAVKHPLTNLVLPPKALTGPANEVPPEHDPRVSLADWMLSVDNPTFARVAVNRIWAEVIGVGIVDPVDDLRATNPPSNEALLTALANHFREVGFDQKKLLQTIFTSRTYALSSQPNATNASDARNFSRHYRRRLKAEVLSDAISDVTLREEDFDGMPKGTRAMQLWTHRTNSELLDAFARPDPNQDPPCERVVGTSMTQTLHLMNANHIQKRIAADGGRCDLLAKSDKDPAALVTELYLIIFNRKPVETELRLLCEEFAKTGTDRRRLIEDIMWSMLNSPEFLYLD